MSARSMTAAPTRPTLIRHGLRRATFPLAGGRLSVGDFSLPHPGGKVARAQPVTNEEDHGGAYAVAGGHRGPPLHQATMALVGADLRVRPSITAAPPILTLIRPLFVPTDAPNSPK